jgi:hypothetical protein
MKNLTVLNGKHGAHLEKGRGPKLLRPALALAFIAGALICSNAWAQRGAHGTGGAQASGHAGGHAGGPAGAHGGVHGRLGNHYGGHGWHGRGGGGAIVIGGPLFWPGYGSGWYDEPYYGYRSGRPIVVQPAPAVVYIERTVPSSQPLWYFCNHPQGYYPYVKQCTSPWRAVAPGSVSP